MSESKLSPVQIVDKMMAKDAFSKWMGINVVHVDLGTCRLAMKVKPEMLNGFQIAHGGLTYALSDSALAFAANSHGQHAVSLDTSIKHLFPVKEGDELLANCQVKHKGNSVGVYTVEVFNQDQKLVSYFNGTVKFSREIWA